MNLMDNNPGEILLLDSAQDVIFLISLTGEILYCNQAVEAYGYIKEELQGKSISVLLSNQKALEFEQIRENVLFGEKRDAFDTERISKDNSPVKVSVTYSSVKENGKVTSILSIERKLSIYRKIENKSQALLETAPDAMIIVNSMGQIILVNAQTEQLFGYTKNELLGKEIEIMIPDRFMEKHHLHREHYIENPKTRSMGVGLELFGRRKDGTEFPVEISLSPLQTEGETFVSAAIRDISERKKAEQKFKDLLESAPDAMVIVDKEGTIKLVNVQTEHLFDFKREELLEKNIEILIPERFHASHPGYMKRFFDSPKTRGMGIGLELFGKKKNGDEFPVEISLSPLETEEGLLVSAAIRDISERRYMMELERKNKELEQFAYIASHDLQEPLDTISSFISLIESDFNDSLNTETTEYLGYIQVSANRLRMLITGLLEYSRIGKLSKKTIIDCNKLMSDVIADMHATIVKNKVEIKITELPLIKAYPVEIRQLFQNLLSNAVKFQKPGINPIVQISAVKNDGYWEFIFEDNGIGIDKKYKDKIFVIFQRLHNEQEYRGTGIGLAHCKKIVELHHGKIWMESIPGVGSKFHFTLPELEESL